MTGQTDITVTLQGPFTDTDLEELAVALRQIERRQPKRDFSMMVNTDETIERETLRERLLRMFPAVKGVPVELVCLDIKQKDKSC